MESWTTKNCREKNGTAFYDGAFVINLYSFKFHPFSDTKKTDFFYIPSHYISDVRKELVSSMHSAF